MVDSILTLYKAAYIVIGHTITDTNIASYYQGKIIALDVNEHDGHTEAALIEKDAIYTIDIHGKKTKIGAGPADPGVQ